MKRKREHVCEQCGKCCHHLSATFTPADVNREPRLLDVAITIQQVNNSRTRSFMRDKRHPWAIGKARRGDPCPFLDMQQRCMIHATRPQICRDYPQDGARCIRESELCLV